MNKSFYCEMKGKVSGLLLAFLLLFSFGLAQSSTGDSELLGMLNKPMGSGAVLHFALEFGNYPHKKFFLRDFQESPQNEDKLRLKDKMVYDSDKVEQGFSIPIDFAADKGRISYVGIRGPQILEKKAFKENRKAWAGLLKRNYFGGVRFGMSRSEVVELLGPDIQDQKMLVVKDLNDSVTVHFLFRSGKVDGINLFYLAPTERKQNEDVSGPDSGPKQENSPPQTIFSKKKNLHNILDLTPGLPETIGAPGLRLSFIRTQKDPKLNGLYLDAYCLECPGTKSLAHVDSWMITMIGSTYITPEMGPEEIRTLLQGKVGTKINVRFRSQVFPLLRNNYPFAKVTWVELE